MVRIWLEYGYNMVIIWFWCCRSIYEWIYYHMSFIICYIWLYIYGDMILFFGVYQENYWVIMFFNLGNDRWISMKCSFFFMVNHQSICKCVPNLLVSRFCVSSSSSPISDANPWGSNSRKSRKMSNIGDSERIYSPEKNQFVFSYGISQ